MLIISCASLFGDNEQFGVTSHCHVLAQTEYYYNCSVSVLLLQTETSDACATKPGYKRLVLVLIATLTSLQAPLEINALLQQFSSHSLAVFRPAHNLLCTRRKKKDL